MITVNLYLPIKSVINSRAFLPSHIYVYKKNSEITEIMIFLHYDRIEHFNI
jgi:hypothetical protein